MISVMTFHTKCVLCRFKFFLDKFIQHTLL
jgi:hypothetical protein